jgi:uncharacterized protein YjbJ (UPF0337 family)
MASSPGNLSEIWNRRLKRSLQDYHQNGVTKKMDKDRIVGATKEAKGTVKETIGKVVGDANLAAAGATEKTEGKVQNAIGGLKDALKK